MKLQGGVGATEIAKALARIMHHGTHFRTSARRTRAVGRSDRTGVQQLANTTRLGLICLARRASGHDAPPLIRWMARGEARRRGIAVPPGSWSATGCGFARGVRSPALR